MPTVNLRFPRIIRWMFCLLCALAGVSAAAKVHGAEGQPPKRVLIVSTGSRFSSFPIAEQAIVDRLREVHPAELEFYSEYLDIVRFQSESYQRLFRDYLRDKYAQDLPDLIFLIFVGNLGTAAELLGELFPKAPVVVVGLTEEELPSRGLPGRVTGVAQRSDPAGTLELMLRLQPEIRRIVLVGGSADVDRHVMSRARQALRSLGDPPEVEVWDKRSMPEILTAASSLPPQSAILFTRMFRDGAGGAVNSSQAARAIAKVSNVPVYVMTDTMLGTGAVGGSTVDLVALGGRGGEIAERVLSGTASDTLPLEIISHGVPIFDWRALKRWGISENRLPQNSIVRFRSLSMWEQYRWYIIAALVIFSLQGALITGLVFNRAARRRTENVLRENQEMMEMAANAGRLGLWARDLKSDQLWANSVLRSLFGFGPNEPLRAGDVLERIHPDDSARVVSDVERARDANSLFEGEFRTRLPGGDERWVMAKGSTVTVANGHEARRMGVLLDITERKRAEEQLRESEDNFRRLVETTAAVIWQADMKSWTFTYVAPQAVKLLGYPLDQWYEKDFWISHIHPDDRERAIDTCLTMSRSGEDFDFEYRMTRLSGEVIWVHDFVSCQHQAGEPSQLRGLMLDVTERKSSERAIRESEERLAKERAFLRQVIDIDPNFIFAKDRDGRFTLANRAVADAYGTTVENLIGKSDADFNPHADEVEFFHRMDLEVVDTLQERFIPEEHVTDAEGKIRWLQTVKRPIVEQDGRANQVLGASTDITARKIAEAELQRNRDELAHMTRVSTLGELAASLAHELNQPLTAILSNAQAAQRFLSVKPTDMEEIKDILKDIVEDNSRASEVIRRMRALVKKEDLTFEVLDLAGVVHDVIQLIHSDAILRNVRVSFAANSNLPAMRGDRVQLQQVVLNLLLNAFEAMNDTPAAEREVAVRVEFDGVETVEVAVCDRGTGMTSEKFDKIFQPFFTTKRDGLGMGLSISRSIVERHSGRLWAENNRERGATFHMVLPVEGKDGARDG